MLFLIYVLARSEGGGVAGKHRLVKEGNETVTNCHALKLRAADGKMRMGDAWLDAIVPIFRAAKPMMDMMNAVIDDYE